MSEQQTRESDANGRHTGTRKSDCDPPRIDSPSVSLDVEKLHSLPSEQQDLYLFTFSVELEAHTRGLEYETLCQEQKSINDQILGIVGLASPVPSKAVRSQLGRCYANIFGRGNRRILFECVNRLVSIVATGKGDKDIHNKHAAAYCLGEVYKAAGDSAINLAGHAATCLIKLLKLSSNHAGLRAAIFKALKKIVEGIKVTVDEGVAREIWKQARLVASSDNAALVQARACECLEQLLINTTYFDNVNDYETLKTTIWKASEASIPGTRHAAASTLATSLVKAYSEQALSKDAPKIKKPKKSARPSAVLEEAGEEITRPSSPSNAKKTVLKLELSLLDIFRQLSGHYLRPATNNRVRAVIVQCYMKILTSLEASTVETTYGQLLDHLLTELLSRPFIHIDRHRLLLTRKFVHRILSGCVASKILGESGRLNAAKIIINQVLKNYPQVLKESAEPSKHVLVGALDALASLIRSLGSAFRPSAEGCREALLQILQHPSYTVQIHAAYCLRAYVSACPQQLLSCASICMNSLKRELGHLEGARQSPRRCIGYANGLAAILSISPSQPLYSSLEICSRVLTMAIDLLKSSSQADIRIAGVQVQVAWNLIGGLMALGPTFVKIHLTQFLLLWRNALPKALTKENTAQRQSFEISYLTHVRECTLGSVLLFLQFNGRLVTVDIAKRIASMLQNTAEYLESLPIKKVNDEGIERAIASLTIQELVVMTRRRVLQCYGRLIGCNPMSSGELLTQTNVLTSAVALFADPEAYSAGTLGTSIANSVGTFDNIWEVADNHAFGVTGLVRGPAILPLPSQRDYRQQSAKSNVLDSGAIDEALICPIAGAQEHDSVYLHSDGLDNLSNLPDPPATEVVNAAISLFGAALPLQAPKIQEAVLEQLATFLASANVQRDPGRRAAVMVNTAMALLSSLKVVTGETTAEHGDLRHPPVETSIEEMLRSLLMSQDPWVRHIAYEGLGRLCNSSGNTFTANEINALIDTIVANRDPNARAGCAMALGSIHAQVGGMAAGFHLKKIHGILMSLCSDPHPVVHYCAIKALSEVADSAGLTFSGYVSSTLGLLAQLWTCDSHNEEAGLSNTSNAEFEEPTAIMIAKCVDSLINVLGPDLQDMSKVRALMLMLLEQFDGDDTPNVQTSSLRAWEHIYLYDPHHVDLGTYVRRLQTDLNSQQNLIRDVAVDGLYNLMRKDADQVLSVADDGMGEQVWQALNENPEHEGIRNTIFSWLGQSSLTDTERWITRCQQVLTKATAPKTEVVSQMDLKSAGPDLQDEEVAGFAATEGKDESSGLPEVAKELLRWQVRAFAMQCLSDLVAIVGKDLELDPESKSGHALQDRIADVIRLAFLASTASVSELQIGGLRLIDQILRIFGTMPDPDFQEALLLEQYQAQISSALTPAFSTDSSPDLASAAVSVCATFISTGLVTDVDRMGRILKLLVTALQSFTGDEQDAAVGDLKGLSSNAQTMVKMAVLSAWAELQVASIQQQYLVKVVKPYIATLTPLWLSSLQEFARLRFEPDISNNTGPARPDEGLDVVYAALNRQALLKFYQDSWLRLVDAIASLIDQDSDFVFDALDGGLDKSRSRSREPGNYDINYRDEPAAFFFVLFGIVIEALAIRPSGGTSSEGSQVLEILSAMKRILRPSVCGNAIYQDSVFSETVEMFDRLALTEGLDVQILVVDIARNLCVAHPSARGEDDNEGHISDDIEQLFELTRIMVLVLAGILPNLSEQNPSSRPQLPDEAVVVIQKTLEALVDVADIFPAVIKTDLHASILHIFASILSISTCQANVVPQALPVLKRFLVRGASKSSHDLLRSCLGRFLSILSHAQRRESENSLPCAKNTLLACTILLTTASGYLAPNDPLLDKALDAMLDCLTDIGLAKVASSCLRSLMMTHPRNPTDEAMARYLLPHLIHFALDTTREDPEDARALTAHTLTSFVATTIDEATSAAMCCIIPVILKNAAADGPSKYANWSKRLLELAGARLMPAFRGVMMRMSAEQKDFMQTVIREGGGGGKASNGRLDGDDDVEEPTIALKMNFGG